MACLLDETRERFLWVKFKRGTFYLLITIYVALFLGSLPNVVSKPFGG